MLNFKKLKNKIKYDFLFYTGPIDEFFNYKFGNLDYRCLKLDFQTFNQESYQPSAVVNYPNNYDFTRITEFKKLTQQNHKKTTIAIEYPGNDGFMAYPVLDEKNKKLFSKIFKRNRKTEKAKYLFCWSLGRI